MARRIVAPGLVRLGRRMVGWVFKMPVHDEVEQEIDFHVEMRAREFEGRGMSPEEARRAVYARFGDLARVKADLERLGAGRDGRMERSEWWGETGRDVRYAVRQLRRSPAFTLVAVFTLALGIGANTAVFSVLNGVLLRPLPYAASDRLVMVTSAFPTLGFDRFWVSPPEYFELKDWSQAFEDLGGYRVVSDDIETLDQPLRVTSAVTTWSLFPTLGVGALRGRTYTPEEDLPDASPVVLISHGLWQRAFGGDPSILGSSVRVSGQPRTVVGIMPEGFDLEDSGVDLWKPVGIDPSDHVNRRGNHFLNVIARLDAGITLERAQADLDRLEIRWQEEYGDTHAPDAERHPYQASDLRTDLLGDVRPAMILLMGAVGFVLLIACANVANLLLARSEYRQREVAVRVAMGAGRGRLVRQLLAEGVTLGLAGGLLGLALGWTALQAILAVNPDIPRSEGIRLDSTVMVFTAAVSVATGLVFGLAPLLSTTLARVGGALSEGGTRTTKGGAGTRVRKLLVVAEVALAVILLTGSGLMLRSLSALQRVDLGFRPDHLLTFEISLPNNAYPDPDDIVGFYGSLIERVRSLPGVIGATAMSGLPPLREVDANDTEFEGVERTRGRAGPQRRLLDFGGDRLRPDPGTSGPGGPRLRDGGRGTRRSGHDGQRAPGPHLLSGVDPGGSPNSPVLWGRPALVHRGGRSRRREAGRREQRSGHGALLPEPPDRRHRLLRVSDDEPSRPHDRGSAAARGAHPAGDRGPRWGHTDGGCPDHGRERVTDHGPTALLDVAPGSVRGNRAGSGGRGHVWRHVLLGRRPES